MLCVVVENGEVLRVLRIFISIKIEKLKLNNLHAKYKQQYRSKIWISIHFDILLILFYIKR